jgi:hypothetical protein
MVATFEIEVIIFVFVKLPSRPVEGNFAPSLEGIVVIHDNRKFCIRFVFE